MNFEMLLYFVHVNYITYKERIQSEFKKQKLHIKFIIQIFFLLISWDLIKICKWNQLICVLYKDRDVGSVLIVRVAQNLA